MYLKNKYAYLKDQVRQASDLLREWELQCTTVYLKDSCHSLPLRLLHGFIENNFPEVVFDSTFYDGGSSSLTLKAPVEDVSTVLLLTIDFDSRIKEQYGARILEIAEKLEATACFSLNPDYF